MIPAPGLRRGTSNCADGPGGPSGFEDEEHHDRSWVVLHTPNHVGSRTKPQFQWGVLARLILETVLIWFCRRVRPLDGFLRRDMVLVERSSHTLHGTAIYADQLGWFIWHTWSVWGFGLLCEER